MADLTAEVVICGAGIAGIAAAYHLAVTHGMTDVVLVERGAPLSMTSDKSTECYRNWWPGPDDAMVGLMNRSIDLLEQIARRTDNLIGMNRRGYLFATADPTRVLALHRSSKEAERLGAGPLRVHDGRSGGPTYVPGRADGFEGQPDGADLITDPELIREHFPYLSPRTVAVLHPRRCGWFSAQQLGMSMLEEARRRGVRLTRGEVTAIDTASGRVRSVTVATDGGARTISTPRFVNAAGPLLKAVGEILGVELPVVCERHLKLSFNDHLEVVPRGAPLLIWSDDVVLRWSETEREALAASDENRWLLGRLPPGVHCRPEGHGDSRTLLVLWTYDMQPVDPVFPLPITDHFAELVLRGMAVMIPGLAHYLDRIPRPYVDGGYYTKTRENRPLIGPLPIEGGYVVGALSGYGVMAACAAGELLAAHIMGAPLPRYAPAFTLSRYADPSYQKLLENWGDSGQL